MVGLQLALTAHKAILCPKLACDSPPMLNLQDDNNQIITITTLVPDNVYASGRDIISRIYRISLIQLYLLQIDLTRNRTFFHTGCRTFDFFETILLHLRVDVSRTLQFVRLVTDLYRSLSFQRVSHQPSWKLTIEDLLVQIWRFDDSTRSKYQRE